jgi:hypothetical protein
MVNFGQNFDKIGENFKNVRKISSRPAKICFCLAIPEEKH